MTGWTEWEQTLRGASHREILRAGGGAPAIVRAVRARNKKQLAARLKPRLDALLREGTTTIEIKSGYGLAVAEEMKMLRRHRAREQRVAGHGRADRAAGVRRSRAAWTNMRGWS